MSTWLANMLSGGESEDEWYERKAREDIARRAHEGDYSSVEYLVTELGHDVPEGYEMVDGQLVLKQ